MEAGSQRGDEGEQGVAPAAAQVLHVDLLALSDIVGTQKDALVDAFRNEALGGMSVLPSQLAGEDLRFRVMDAGLVSEDGAPQVSPAVKRALLVCWARPRAATMDTQGNLLPSRLLRKLEGEAGMSVLKAMLYNLVRAGLEEVTIIAGAADGLEEHVDDSFLQERLCIRWHYLPEEYYGFHASAILDAKDVMMVGDEPFLLLTSDHLFHPLVLHELAMEMVGAEQISDGVVMCEESLTTHEVGLLPHQGYAVFLTKAPAPNPDGFVETVTAVTVQGGGGMAKGEVKEGEGGDEEQQELKCLEMGAFVLLPSALFEALTEVSQGRAYFTLAMALDRLAKQGRLRCKSVQARHSLAFGSASPGQGEPKLHHIHQEAGMDEGGRLTAGVVPLIPCTQSLLPARGEAPVELSLSPSTLAEEVPEEVSEAAAAAAAAEGEAGAAGVISAPPSPPPFFPRLARPHSPAQSRTSSSSLPPRPPSPPSAPPSAAQQGSEDSVLSLLVPTGPVDTRLVESAATGAQEGVGATGEARFFVVPVGGEEQAARTGAGESTKESDEGFQPPPGLAPTVSAAAPNVAAVDVAFSDIFTSQGAAQDGAMLIPMPAVREEAVPDTLPEAGEGEGGEGVEVEGSASHADNYVFAVDQYAGSHVSQLRMPSDIQHIHLEAVVSEADPARVDISIVVDSKTPFIAWVIVGVALIGEATAGPIAKLTDIVLGRKEVSGITLSLWRYSASALLSTFPFLVRAALDPSLVHRQLTDRQMVSQTALAGLASSVWGVCFYSSLLFTTVSKASLLSQTTPVLICLWKLLKREPLAPKEVSGLTTAMLGAVLVSVAQNDASETSSSSPTSQLRDFFGMGLALTSATANAVFYRTAHDLRRQMDPSVFFWTQRVIVSIYTSIVLWVAGEVHTFRELLVGPSGIFGWMFTAGLGLIVLQMTNALLTDYVAIMGMFLTFKYISALVLSVIFLTSPVLTVLTDLLLGLEELPGPLFLIGSVMVLLGAAIVCVSSAEARHETLDATAAVRQPMDILGTLDGSGSGKSKDSDEGEEGDWVSGQQLEDLPLLGSRGGSGSLAPAYGTAPPELRHRRDGSTV